MKSTVTETKRFRDTINNRLDTQERELVKWKRDLRKWSRMLQRETKIRYVKKQFKRKDERKEPMYVLECQKKKIGRRRNNT